MPLRRIAIGLALSLFAGCVEQSAAPTGVASPSPPVASAPDGGVSGGMSVLGSRGLLELALHGESKRVSAALVNVEGQPFDQAFRIEIKEKSTNPWDVQLQTPTSGKVEKGDVLLATFYLRTEWAPVESGEGQTEFVFELARDPWTKSTSYPVRGAREWKKFHVPFVAESAYAPGEAQMIFRLGYDRQTIEIGGLEVENFGTKVALSALPVTKLDYPGMAPDAPWRAAAAERIEKLLKAELRVIVKDKAGKVVPGAEVSVRLTKHAFGFGTCA